MRYVCLRVLLVGSTLIGSGWSAPHASAASGLFDWLSNCGGGSTPVTVYYPVTTGYVTSVTSSADCSGPTVCCDVPCPVYCPPVAVQETRPSLWQRLCSGCGTGSAQRQTLFRTNWTKIPVTSYRPTVMTDPVTGCPVTIMQPCTTYTWQAERQRCGFFDRLFGRCDPGPATPVSCGPTVMAGATPLMSGMGTSDCCGPATTVTGPMTVMPSPSAAPYYAPGSPVPTPAVPGSAPADMPPTLSPQSAPAPGGPVMPPSTAPADIQPRLKPADVDPPVQSGGEDESVMSALPSFGPSSSSSSSPSSGGSVPGPILNLGPPILNGDPPRVNPVPGPNASPAVPAEEPAPPPLLDPRDQMASLRSGQPWSYSTATWPAGTKSPGAAKPPIQLPRDTRRWDESGWTSARPAGGK